MSLTPNGDINNAYFMRQLTTLSSRTIGVLLQLFIFASPSLGHAQNHQDSKDNAPISFRSQATILLAGHKDYSLEDVQNNKKLSFVPLTSLKENLGFSGDQYWIHFDINNPSSETTEYYLETARPITDVVDLYVVDEKGQVQMQRSGDKIPFWEKSVQHRKSIFDIHMEPHQKLEAYVHLKSDGEVVMLPLRLYSKNQFFALTYKEQVFYGVFYGILLLACIIYLFFFAALGDRVFIYYGLYVLFIALMEFSLDGFFHQYVTPQGGWLSDKTVLLTAFISLFFFGRYGDRFLDLKKNSPILHRINIVLGSAIGVGLAIMALVPQWFTYCYPLANGVGILVLVHMIASLIVLRGKKVSVDPFFTIGISFLVLGFVVFILNNFNTIENSFFTNNGAKFGIGLEIIFLSISMSNRIRNLRMENEKNQLLALQRSEDMNAIKSSFLSNISHELRTPLNLIMGVANSLNDAGNKEDLEEKCRLIMSSSKNLLGQIEDILDFTVIEKGDQELKEVSFELPSTLQKIARAQEKKALAKNLDFKCTLPEDLPNRIVGDKGKLAQMLNHLLDNAIKFTNTGVVALEVVCKRKKNGLCELNFTIADTGIGISKEKMSTVFESFTKKSFIDKREFSGLGLGLYIVKTYADLQGGEITISNNELGGTTCQLQLAYTIDEDTVVLAPEPQAVPSEAPSGPAQILLVEDNKMNQTVVKLLFKKWENLELTIANHGQEALDLMESHTYDLILMDLQMPVMDGFETTSIIRSGKAHCEAQIPIIVMTADNTSTTRKEIFRLGTNDLVTKPVNGELLFSKIQHYLNTASRVA